MSSTKKSPIVVLISGSGSNLQAIIDAAGHDLPVDIRAVISNREEAFGLERARRAGIPAETLNHQAYDSREAFDSALTSMIDAHQPDLVVLAGFMRILTPALVGHYQGRMLNIHPSLLPDFRGLDTHARVLKAGVDKHGASVHFVTPELDGGPVIVQARVPVLAGDNTELLAQRVLEQEHIIYPLAIRWFAENRIRLQHDRLVLDGLVQTQPVQYNA